MNKAQLKRLLEDNNWRLNNQLGQYFFINQHLLSQVLDLITPRAIAVEIGPGLGCLTALLVKKYSQVIAVEIDKRFQQYLQNTYPTVQFHFADFLDFDLTNLKNYQIIANIPYYITSDIIMKMLQAPYFQEAFLLVEKATISRIYLEKEPSFAAYIIRQISKMELLIDVANTDFFPICPVESCFVKIIKTEEFPEETTFMGIKNLMSHKRKKLPLEIRQKINCERFNELTYQQLKQLFGGHHEN